MDVPDHPGGVDPHAVGDDAARPHLSRQVREDTDGFVAQWLAGRDGAGLGPHQREALAGRRWVHRMELALRGVLGATLVGLVVLGAQRLG